MMLRFLVGPAFAALVLVLVFAPGLSSLRSSPSAVQPSAPPVTIDDVVGVWAGEVEHNGETVPVGVEFERRDGVVRTIVVLPAIHGRAGLGPAAVKASTIEAGGIVFELDRAAGTLTTVLPEGFLPRYRLRFTLRRAESFALPERRLPQAPERQPSWTADLGASTWADAAYADDRAFIGADNGVMHAFDARTGRPLWTFAAGGAIRSRATFAGSDLLFQSDDGYVYRLDAGSGHERWRVRVAEKPMTRLPIADPKGRYENRASAAAVAGGRLFVGTHEGHVIALDSRGRRLWSFKANDSITTTPTVTNGSVFVGSFDRHVYAIDAASGRQLWKYDTGDAMTSDIALHGSQVIAGSRSYDLEALDAARGTPIWKKYFWFSWVESSPTVADGVVYIGSSDAARVFAIDGATGKSIWELDAGGSAWGRPAVTASRVYEGVAGVVTYVSPHHGAVLGIDRKSGALLWRYTAPPPSPTRSLTPDLTPGPTPYGFAGSVALGGGLVFAGGLDGRLYAFAQ
jgi:outer membrane protein assembly factor BamB